MKRLINVFLSKHFKWLYIDVRQQEFVRIIDTWSEAMYIKREMKKYDYIVVMVRKYQ